MRFPSVDALSLLDSSDPANAAEAARSGAASDSSKKKGKDAAPPLDPYLRSEVILDYAAALWQVSNRQAAEQVINNGQKLMRGSGEEARFSIRHAQLRLRDDEVEAAVLELKKVRPEQAHYLKSVQVLANAYLQHHNDKRSFILCYKNLLEGLGDKSLLGYLFLGDAYMRIQEPDLAISVYEKAKKLDPDDVLLVRKIGQAMITTHDFARAIEYYKAAMAATPNNHTLRRDLADLYTKLRRFQEADAVLQQSLVARKRGGTSASKDDDAQQAKSARAIAIEMLKQDTGEAEGKTAELHNLIEDVQVLLTMAQVHMGAGAEQRASECLLKARDLQTKEVLPRVKGEESEVVQQQKDVAATICQRLADYFADLNDTDKALGYYQEALQNDPSHESSILALAKLHLKRGELDACQHQCMLLNKMGSGNEEAALMDMDLMFQKGEFDYATNAGVSLLEQHPNNYVALARMVELLRRAGKLSAVAQYLKVAEEAADRSHAPGLHFCKGLFHRYSNSPRTAMTEFIQSRRDAQWGPATVEQMIEIYLNPDDSPTLGETSDENEYVRAVQQAGNLLKELRHPDGAPGAAKTALRHQVLRAYVLMATKNKSDIDEALKMLAVITEKDRDYVPALLAIAQAHKLRKEVPKARNQLKRISKMTFDHQYANEFEKAWLLQADIFISSGKFDIAGDMIKQALAKNLSCAKAWEFRGYINEKEQAYKDAAEDYERAWTMQNESNPSIGFRLAFNYLKAKRHVDAIDVCHKVLDAFPTYPKIRKDILDRARASLRDKNSA